MNPSGCGVGDDEITVRIEDDPVRLGQLELEMGLMAA